MNSIPEGFKRRFAQIEEQLAQLHHQQLIFETDRLFLEASKYKKLKPIVDHINELLDQIAKEKSGDIR